MRSSSHEILAHEVLPPRPEGAPVGQANFVPLARTAPLPSPRWVSPLSWPAFKASSMTGTAQPSSRAGWRPRAGPMRWS